MGRSMVLCAAYTPVLAGPDVAEYVIPNYADGVTPVTWSVKRVVWRAQIAETSASVINLEKSTGPGVFSPVVFASATLPTSAYEAISYSYVSASVVSGDKIRFNVVNVGTAQNWTIITEISNA